ncbi:MAG TPA: FkbM family methyltransferase [Armatimonadota bacterium]|nr:FkbM family methyltransferase [Armatimonadota bacterium]
MTSWRKAVENWTFPILRGRLAGKRWLVKTSTSYFLGRYEREQTRAFVETMREGLVVFDVGANIGYYTLTAALAVGTSGGVFAFEPLEQNFRRLERHVQANRLHNVTIVKAAVGDRRGVARLEIRSSPGLARLSENGTVEVPLVSLDSMIQGGELPLPDVIKIDVEGAEMLVLKGAVSLFASAKPLVFLSTHGIKEEEECLRFLSERGYTFETLKERPSSVRKEFIAKHIGTPSRLHREAGHSM